MILGGSRFVPLVRKNGVATCAAFLSTPSGVGKALVLMMGSNQLPASEGLSRLGDAFRQSAAHRLQHSPDRQFSLRELLPGGLSDGGGDDSI
jgi:hypothetical protein